LNLGGDGEETDVINQQPEWSTSPGSRRTIGGRIDSLVAAGHPFLFCQNANLPFADGGIDFVFSNNVPVDQMTWLGLGIQSSEIQRVLRPGGQWQHNGTIVFTKP
jgi:hypothetical protein